MSDKCPTCGRFPHRPIEEVTAEIVAGIEGAAAQLQSKGADAERARIVAWLQEQAAAYGKRGDVHDTVLSFEYDALARSIAANEHRGAPR